MRIAASITSIVFGVLFLTLLIFRESFLVKIGNYLAIKDDLQHAGVVHVISGPDYRTDYGIELVKKGYTERIFFTGGWCDEIQGYHGQRGRDRALDQGLQEAAIGLDDTNVTSTYDEALRLKAYIEILPKSVDSVLVVSDPFHMRRVQWTYQKVLGKDIQVILAPVPFDRTPFKEDWWKDPVSRTNVKEEYLKLVYYFLRYQVTSGSLKTWLASLDTE
jgi:uncharacterized SAM-binding protein YcdF (DUF218 family)